MLALEGITIIEIGRGATGVGTWFLGDLGADVITITPPFQVGGRDGGAIRPPTDEAEARRDAVYDAIGRNKRSMAIDLKSENGRHIFCQLADKADVIVEGFRPGVAKRLGIDYEAISKINSRIVYCSATGYGQDGPYRNMPGHDTNYIATGGALDLIGEAGGKPVMPLNLVGDWAGAALQATIGILAALIARSKTGKGQFIDISYTDGVIALMSLHATFYFRDGIVPKRGETVLGGAYPYAGPYECRDGKYIALGFIEPWQWANFCREIGREDFMLFHFQPEHFLKPPEGEKWQEIRSFLTQLFLTKSRDEWFELLRDKDVNIARVLSIDEVFTDPQVLHRKMVVEVEHPTMGKIKQVGIPIKLSDTPGKVRSLAPLLGEHTEEILRGLGYSKQRIKELREEGTIN